MSIHHQVLGRAGRDNSLFLQIDSGNKLYRVLIDCGENTLSEIPQSDVKSIDIVLLSHLHLDHIAGFDYLFRRTFDRDGEPVNIFGPEETSSIIHNRFRGFKWNLTEGLSGGYFVTDIFKDRTEKSWYEAKSGFADKVQVDSSGYSDEVFINNHFSISAALLNHRIPSIGYCIKETDSINIKKEELEKLNLKPGPWLNRIKDNSFNDNEQITAGDKNFIAGDLREKLINHTPGERITYLTDFLSDSDSENSAVKLARGSDVMVCESQYLSEDEALASQNYHLTSRQAAALAVKAGVKKLILFHVSERYIHNEIKMKQMLAEARSIFPETYFPGQWNLH